MMELTPENVAKTIKNFEVIDSYINLIWEGYRHIYQEGKYEAYIFIRHFHIDFGTITISVEDPSIDRVHQVSVPEDWLYFKDTYELTSAMLKRK